MMGTKKSEAKRWIEWKWHLNKMTGTTKMGNKKLHVKKWHQMNLSVENWSFFCFFLAVAGSQVRMRHLQVLESRVTRWKGKLHFFFGTFYSGRLPSENARISRWTFYFAIDPNETVTLASKKCNQETVRVPFFFVVGGWSHEGLR